MKAESNRHVASRSHGVCVTPGDLARAIEALEHLSKPDDASEQQVEQLEKLFEGNSEKALVVRWRLEAMSTVVALGQLPPGAELDTPVGSRKESPLVVAAATEPLMFSNDEPRFDADQFAKSVLAIMVSCYPCLNAF